VITPELSSSEWPNVLGTFGLFFTTGTCCAALRLPPWDLTASHVASRTVKVARRNAMFDQTVAPTTDDAPDIDRVAASAQTLFERLNPPVRDPEIAPDAPALPVYDWEIAADTGIDLDDVRASLRDLDGQRVDVTAVHDEQIVLGLSDQPVADVA